jgi:hypothetical protein
MRDNSIIKQIEECLETHSQDDYRESLIERRDKMLAEWESLRVKNRKLLFGLWLCKFAQNYSARSQPIVRSEIGDYIVRANPIHKQKTLQYSLAILILISILIALLLKLFIEKHSIT